MVWVKTIRLSQNNKANNFRSIFIHTGNEYDKEIEYVITSRIRNDKIIIEYYKENINYVNCMDNSGFLRKEDFKIVEKFAKKYQKWLRFECDLIV